MKRGCFLLFILLQQLCVFAQSQNIFVSDSTTKKHKEPLHALTIDRPDQTDSPYVIPPGFFQVETGVQHQWDHYQSDSMSYSYRSLTYPNLLLRYGIMNNIELRIEGNYGNDRLKVGTRDQISKAYGFYPVLISAKIKLWNQKGLRPNFALLTKLFTPLHNRNSKPLVNKFATGLAGAFSHTISDKCVLDGSVGGFIDQATGQLITHYSLSQAIELTEKISMFIEFFGIKPARELTQYGTDAGILYLLSPHIQLDIFASKSISYQAIDLFIGTGIGFRLPQK